MPGGPPGLESPSTSVGGGFGVFVAWCCCREPSSTGLCSAFGLGDAGVGGLLDPALARDGRKSRATAFCGGAALDGAFGGRGARFL